ncbi:hypothetical protein [Sinorhizobium meliloti]|uniref:hypothetical protein n=1 Tax=Rhizobium meliloti TaxID=382 RepID=UPI000FD28AAC|nr:hypothetical protein [Sinorhizobium meliloti]MDE3818756.1 hypothetical protein [Sinorhizobium meliloti]MDW9572102.1 hypothetical protein [Sinorhizobium meliloti]MDW9613090.1 hypothetical protein [Sinorhizobium meliloti]MDW9835442.1 hypothetical protein [Sinorhizobium meliloti]MDW9878197.1 hypothetical protein [Sinorhizobium meliloti]
MTDMTRRAMLGVGAAAMPLIATSFYKAAAPPVMPPSGLLPFADRTAELPHATLQTLQERLEAAIATAADCLREMNAAPGLELLVERSDGWVFIGTRTPPKPVEWSGADFYQIEQGDTRPTYWIERVEYKTKPGFYYRAVSRWKGRDEGRPIRIEAADLRIVRKRSDFAGRLTTDHQQISQRKTLKREA